MREQIENLETPRRAGLGIAGPLRGALIVWMALHTLHAAADGPVIHWFRATPSTIAVGESSTLRWHVDGAAEVIINNGIGTVPAIGSIPVTPDATTTYLLTASGEAGSSSTSRTVVVGPHPNARGGRYVHMISPISTQLFTAPATLRLFAAAYDPTGDGGYRRHADRVDFYVDDTLVAYVLAADSEFWVFKTRVGPIGAGRHRVWARAVYTDPAEILHSESMWISVEPQPAYAQTITLDDDLVLSDDQSSVLVGTADARIRINGQGHRIRSEGSWTGTLDWRNVDLFGVGPQDSATPAIELSNASSIRIEDSRFDTTGTLALDLAPGATANLRGNEFRSNMSMPTSQQPEYEPGASYPAFRVRGGGSDVLKRFQGNRIGLGWADFRNTGHWLIGGDSESDSNIVIAPRGGIWAQNTSRTELRGNLSYHVYYGGWSQGNNMEMNGSHDILIEHNVVGGGSWPIRGFSGSLRYNLMLDAGHEFLWITGDNAAVHHNVFAGGDGDQAPIRLIYGPQNARIYNNTLDGLGRSTMNRPVWVGEGAQAILRSNAIVNMPNPPAVQIDHTLGATLDADYNLFSGQTAAEPRNYSDNRQPSHDIGTHNAQVDPMFSEPAEPLRYDLGDLWSRTISVRQVLANYRTRYTPGPGSPLTDSGDPGVGPADTIMHTGFESSEPPQGGAGNDVGAVGSGIPSADDRFGL